MPEAQETMEHAVHAEHAAHSNRKIAMVIAVLALFLSFSETLGKSAQTEFIDANVKASDAWAFFQAKDIRKTTVLTAADQTALLAAGFSDPAAKAAADKQIETWRKTAERYESDRKTATDARNSRNAPRRRKANAIFRWRDIIIMSFRRRRSRSASCSRPRR